MTLGFKPVVIEQKLKIRKTSHENDYGTFSKKVPWTCSVWNLRFVTMKYYNFEARQVSLTKLNLCWEQCFKVKKCFNGLFQKRKLILPSKRFDSFISNELDCGFRVKPLKVFPRSHWISAAQPLKDISDKDQLWTLN